MFYRSIFFLVLLKSSILRGAATPVSHLSRSSLSPLTSERLTHSASEQSNSLLHAAQRYEPDDLSSIWQGHHFSGSPVHSPGSDDAHSEIDWGELDKALFDPNKQLSPPQIPSTSEDNAPSRQSSPRQTSPRQASPRQIHSEIGKKNVLNLDVIKFQNQMNQVEGHKHIYMDGGNSQRQVRLKSWDAFKQQHKEKSISSEKWQTERYSSYPWQRSFKTYQQEQIYKTIREQPIWGPYHQGRFKAGYRKLRQILDEKTAMMILDGDRKTIQDIARRSKPPTWTSADEEKKRKSKTSYWPDKSIAKEQRFDLIERLALRWKLTKNAAKARLVAHYIPELKASLTSSNNDQFSKAVDYLSQKSSIGKHNGKKLAEEEIQII